MNTSVQPQLQTQSSLGGGGGVVPPGGGGGQQQQQQQGGQQYPVVAATTIIPSNTGASSTTTGTSITTNNTTIQQLGTSYWLKQPKANAELFALTYGALVAELVRDIEDPTKITEELDRMGHSIGIRCIEDVLAKKAISDPTSTSTSFDYSSSSSSSSFYESADLMKLAFRMFLGIVIDCSIIDPVTASAAAAATQGSAVATTTTTTTTNYQAYSIKFIDNPLTIFVELPEEYRSSSSKNNNTSTTQQQNQNPNQQSSSSTKIFEYNQLLAGMVRGMLEMLHYDCTCTVSNSILHGNDYNEIQIILKQILQDGAGDDYHEE